MLLADTAVAGPPPPGGGLFDAAWGRWLEGILERAFGPVLTTRTREELREGALQVGPPMFIGHLAPDEDWRVLGSASLRAACDLVPALILADGLRHLGARGRARIVEEALTSPEREVREWGISMVTKLREGGRSPR